MVFSSVYQEKIIEKCVTSPIPSLKTTCKFFFITLNKMESNFGLYGCNELLNLLLHNLRGSLDSSNVQTSCYKCTGWFQKVIKTDIEQSTFCSL